VIEAPVGVVGQGGLAPPNHVREPLAIEEQGSAKQPPPFVFFIVESARAVHRVTESKSGVVLSSRGLPLPVIPLRQPLLGDLDQDIHRWQVQALLSGAPPSHLEFAILVSRIVWREHPGLVEDLATTGEVGGDEARRCIGPIHPLRFRPILQRHRTSVRGIEPRGPRLRPDRPHSAADTVSLRISIERLLHRVQPIGRWNAVIIEECDDSRA